MIKINFKNVLFLIFFFNFFNISNGCITFYEPPTQLFYRHDINNVSIYSQNYLSKNGLNYYSIPKKLLTEYQIKLENIKSDLLVKFDLEHRYSITKY